MRTRYSISVCVWLSQSSYCLCAHCLSRCDCYSTTVSRLSFLNRNLSISFSFILNTFHSHWHLHLKSHTRHLVFIICIALENYFQSSAEESYARTTQHTVDSNNFCMFLLSIQRLYIEKRLALKRVARKLVSFKSVGLFITIKHNKKRQNIMTVQIILWMYNRTRLDLKKKTTWMIHV